MQVHRGVIKDDEDAWAINEERKEEKGFAWIESEDECRGRNVLLERRFNWFKR